MIRDLKKAFTLLSSKLKVRFFLLIIFIFIGTLFELVSVALLIPILNVLVGNVNIINKFLIDNKLDIFLNFISIKNILFLFLAIFIIKGLFRLFLVHYQSNFIFTLFTYLINKLYKNYILKYYLFHIKNNSPKIIRNLTQEIHMCSIGYMGAITNIFLEILIIFSLMCFLLYYQPSEILIFILITSLVSLIIIKSLNSISNKLGKKRQKFALINLNTIINGLGGIKDIKVNNKENEIIEKFRSNSENLKINNYLFQVLQQAPKIILELIIVISIVILLIYFLHIDMPKDEIIVLFGLMIGIFSRVLPSIYKLSSSYINLNYYKPALDLMSIEIGNIKNNNDDFTKVSNYLNFEKNRIKEYNFFYNTEKYNPKKCKSYNKKRGNYRNSR